MKRNALFALIALALGGSAVVAQAQDASSWYVAPRIGAVIPDSSRQTDSSVFAGIGAGWWVNPNLAIDAEYSINNADFKSNSFRSGHQWESVGLDVAARWFFGDQGAQWRPYIMGGIGALRHAAYSGSLLTPLNLRNGWDPMATIGGGIQYNLSDRIAVRGELAARYDRDNNTLNKTGVLLGYTGKTKSGFTDGIASIGLVINFGGAAPAPAPAPAAAPPPPPPPPAQEVPPQKVVIDLRGVNFKFDRPKPGEKNIGPTLQVPTADSIAILDQAVDVLNRYPDIKVELDGYTDSIGTAAYNQKLSERRAKIVEGYLTSHGIGADRITAVKGFGKEHPIDTNKTKEGRARNRRTEMVVENQPNQ